jgi:hypothetical protein
VICGLFLLSPSSLTNTPYLCFPCRQTQHQRYRRSDHEDSLDGIFEDVAHEEIQEVDGLVEDIAEEIRDLTNIKVGL